MESRYTSTAMGLHWAIAVLIVWQLVSGVWMVSAINDPAEFANAFWAYQMHKSTGLTVLVLSLARLAWRLGHRPPPLPLVVPAWQRAAAPLVHALLYGLMIAVPLAGWAVASASPLGLPTLVYDWLPLPHLPLSTSLEETTKAWHRGLAAALGGLALGHVAVALKHHVIDGDRLLTRMIPRWLWRD